MSAAVKLKPAEAKPFCKWVGGKRQLLPQLVKHVPARFNRYFEPFAGGAALFWHLNPLTASLSDVNDRLMRTYRAIRDGVEGVIALLSAYPYGKDFYLKLRGCDVDSLHDTHVAAWFIYLNKCGFNGLYRVNKSNGFNVPFAAIKGKQKPPTICDAPRLRACSERLQGVELLSAGFRRHLPLTAKGDLTYLDPPYVPLNATSDFTSYTRDGFTLDDQRALADIATERAKAGVHIIASNSSAPIVRELYDPDVFSVYEAGARRAINCKASKRGPVKELIMVSKHSEAIP